MSTELNENARKWVDALRSGKYQQGHGTLRTPDDKFCCLGVACDVIYPAGWKRLPTGAWMHSDRTFFPNSIRDHLGLTDSASGSLIGQNDFGITFTAIADYIESQPKGLFR